MNTHSYKKILVSGLVASLAFLPGCSFFDNKTSSDESLSSSAGISYNTEEMELTGDVVATMNGKTIITSDLIEREKENVMNSKPELRAALQFMDPKILDMNIAQGLISQAVVDQYAKEQNFDSNVLYQKELADIMRNMKRVLNAKFFSQQFKVTVTDAEVKNFYEENKTMFPELVLSQGGVIASGIQFDGADQANRFAATVKSGNNFARVAQQEGLTVKEFKTVNAQSLGIDAELRGKIANITTVPSVQVIIVNGSAWVINATKKEDTKYVPFDQVKSQIRQRLENTKLSEVFEAEIAKLRTRYNIILNEDYFGGAADPNAMDMMPAGSEMAENRTEDDKAADKTLA